MSKNVSELARAVRSPFWAESVSSQWALYAVASSLRRRSAWRSVKGSVHNDTSERFRDGSGGSGSGGRQPLKGWYVHPGLWSVTSRAATEPSNCP